MINNTSLQRWARITAKSIDAQFIAEMQRGLNCSPFEAQIMAEKVHELYRPLFEMSHSLKPGQVQVLVIDAQTPPGQALNTATQRLVTVTLHDPVPDAAVRSAEGVPALRQARFVRVCEEALRQGGLFTIEDLSLLFNCGVRTLNEDLATLRARDIVPPLRSTVQDIGRAVTHRRRIVGLWLQGLEYSDIAWRTHHSVTSVATYVDTFKRCAALFAAGCDRATVAFLVRISPALAGQYEELLAEAAPAEHRRRELAELAKKTPAMIDLPGCERRRP